MQTRILLYGLGAIGRSVAEAARERPELTVTAGVDPAHAGRRLAELCNGAWPDVIVSGTMREAVARAPADCAIHAAGSRLAEIVPQLFELVDAGLSVVSSAEELLVPSAIDGALARNLDQRAIERGVSIVAAGVNPGLVMDALPVLLASACVRVRAIRVERVVDLARRRLQLQQKLGVGMSPEQFAAAASARALGHVGLAQSMEAISRALEVEIETVEDGLSPIVRDGTVAGADEWRIGRAPGVEVELRLRMEHGATDEHDAVRIEGDPPIELRIPGGVHGDRATVGRLLNAVRYARKVQGLNPGTLW